MNDIAKIPTARKASIADAKIKMLVWGDTGCGKSRFALSSPKPLVIDTEKSTLLYANEFDFLVAEVNANDKPVNDVTKPGNNKTGTNTYTSLILTIIDELSNDLYDDVDTIVIDNITDVLDSYENHLLRSYEYNMLTKKDANGNIQMTRSLGDLSAIERTKWYAYRRDHIRNFIDKIKALDKNIIFTGRSRLEWNGTQPTGNKIFDGHEILPSLMDVVIHLKKERQGEINGIVQKSRLGDLPDVIDVSKGWESISEALINLKNNKFNDKRGELNDAKAS